MKAQILMCAAATCLVLAASLFPSTAAANNYAGATGSQGVGCKAPENIKANNTNHSFNYHELSTVMITASDHALAQDYAPTDLQTGYGSWAGADVRVRDDNYVTYCGFQWDAPITGIFGLAECKQKNASNECAQFAVRFDLPDVQSFNKKQRQFVACHEFGHTVGLMHRASAGCLDTDLTGHHLTAHEVNHINAHY